MFSIVWKLLMQWNRLEEICENWSQFFCFKLVLICFVFFLSLVEFQRRKFCLMDWRRISGWWVKLVHVGHALRFTFLIMAAPTNLCLWSMLVVQMSLNSGTWFLCSLTGTCILCLFCLKLDCFCYYFCWYMPHFINHIESLSCLWTYWMKEIMC